MTAYQHIGVKPITGAMGVEVFDVDLSADLDAVTFVEIKRAFHSHLVLIFRDQKLTDQQQYDFQRALAPSSRTLMSRDCRTFQKFSRLSASLAKVIVGTVFITQT